MALFWFADDCKVTSGRGSEIPDLMFFGGLIIDALLVESLRQQIEAAKGGRYPVKWNMKALRRFYQDNKGLAEKFAELLKTSLSWRSQIFDILSQNKIIVLVACIEHYSKKRQIQVQKRRQLCRYNFANALMRFGLLVNELKPASAIVVADWPEGADPSPFAEEYASAFNWGVTSEKHVAYLCGPLCKLHFHDSIMFTKSLHCTLLQCADLVVGATADFVQACLGMSGREFGVECIRKIWNKFRGGHDPTQVLGRGLIISSGNVKLKEAIQDGIKTFLCA